MQRSESRGYRGEGRRPYWMPIGSGRVNKDGSFNLTFDALPLDGKVNVRVRKEKVADQAEGGASA